MNSKMNNVTVTYTIVTRAQLAKEIKYRAWG